MDDGLKAIIEEIQDAHTLDASIGAHMLAIAETSRRLDIALRYVDKPRILEHDILLQHFARGLRRLMAALQRGDEPNWPPDGWKISRDRDGESQER